MPSNLLKSLSLALFAVLVLLPQQGRGQYALDYGFAVGTANYLGDIGGDNLTRQDFAADLHYGQTKLSTHVFARYRVSSMFAVRAQLGTVYLGGLRQFVDQPCASHTERPLPQLRE